MSNESTTKQDLDLSLLWRRFKPFLLKGWFLLILLGLIGGGIGYLKAVRSYVPMYRSEAVLSVTVALDDSPGIAAYSYYYDNSAANEAVKMFPYLLSSDVMHEKICQELGTTYINGSISASSITGTNFFVLEVKSRDAMDAYNITRAVMTVYPYISSKINGNTQLVISQEPTYATEPYNSFSWRQSVTKDASTGVLIGLFFLFFLSLLRRTALTSDNIRQFFHVPCLAHIPEVTLKKRSRQQQSALLISKVAANGNFAEAFRNLRLKLLRQLKEDEKVIMFTSTLPSEGKSVCAANTALTLASANKRVLLIDADIRSPSIKEVLGIKTPSNGLAVLLRGGKPDLNAYEDTSLYTLADDNGVEDAASLINHDRLKYVIEQVRPHFDYIIMDTPPCSMMADASVYAGVADRVVYVVREDYAAVVQIATSVSALNDMGSSLCGYVFNRTSKASHSHYGYGYGYGYDYGYGRYGGYYGKKDDGCGYRKDE